MFDGKDVENSSLHQQASKQRVEQPLIDRGVASKTLRIAAHCAFERQRQLDVSCDTVKMHISRDVCGDETS
jgi:hypothetical protein